MYRRYYRYNDPAPTAARRAPTAPPPAPKQNKPALSFERILTAAEKDDLILIGLLLLFVMGEEQKKPDFPMILALLYILLQK